MHAFIRQIAVLAVLWTVCELLVPEGRLQQMVRMTVSVLVMTALLSTAGEALQSRPASSPALAQQAVQLSAHTYHRTALQAAANQLSAFCTRFASRAGYEAKPLVYLTEDGGLERIELHVSPTTPLIGTDALVQKLADQLQIDIQRIHLSGSSEEGL